MEKKVRIEKLANNVLSLIREKKYFVAKTMLNKGLAKFGNDPWLLAKKANVLMRLNKDSEANKIIDNELSKKNDKKRRRLFLITKFELLVKNKEYKKAKRLIDRMNNLYPNEHTILEYKGLVLLRLKKPRLALPYLKKAHAMAKKCISCTGTLSSCYLALNQKRKALKMLKSLMSKEKKNIDLLRQIFLTMYGLNMISSASRYLDKVINIKKDSTSYAYKADILSKTGKPNEAIKYYKLAIKLAIIHKEHNKKCKFFEEIYKNYINVLRRLDKQKEIRSISNTALRICPKNKELRRLIKNEIKK